jgi:hypothetical protein
MTARKSFSLALPVAAAVFALVASADAAEDRSGIEFFELKIRPVLVERCYECHSAVARKSLGGLRLDTRDAVLKGGDSGPAVVPGEPEKSPLVKAIRYGDPLLKMPPKVNARLTSEQVADFEWWIKRGAPDPRAGAAVAVKSGPKHDFAAARKQWPFHPLAEPAIPTVKNADWPRNPIDRFVLAAIEQHGLRPVADADKRTLIRRATLDLTGLPPTPEEVEAFIGDGSPDAYEKLIDRLLASPEYGRRWGRHWLDVVRYADTAGDNSDYPVPQLRLYRDYVVDSFNADKPYDRFLREQLSGDLLPYSNEAQRIEQLVATGYLAGSKRFGSRVEDYPWHLTIEDTIDNLGRTFLGLSLTCARCHDHKFDPITSEDYYGLYGIFAGMRYPWPGIELDKVQRNFVPLAPPQEALLLDKRRAEKVAELDAEFKRLEGEKKTADEAVKAAAATDKPAPDALKKKAEAAKAKLDALRKERDRVKNTAPYETAYAAAEGKSAGNVRMHIRGQPENPGREVPRRFLEIFGARGLPSGAGGSGRLDLVDWLLNDSTALFARVMVNRVWHHHFGRGIVVTPNDFGRQGVPPNRPELLDYLAGRFIHGGWSIKGIHRLIMLSRTYRLSSETDVDNAAVDPTNDWQWRFPRRRLEAEAIRDSILFVAGSLDLTTPPGPHPFPEMSKWDFTQHKPFRAVYETDRRSIYLMTQRTAKHPFLAVFDGPDTNASTGRRTNTTTSLQALFFLNDPLVHAAAAKLVDRLHRERTDDDGRIERAYVLLLSRPPTEAEKSDGRRYLAEFAERLAAAKAAPSNAGRTAWESYARALLRLSEFVYLN